MPGQSSRTLRTPDAREMRAFNSSGTSSESLERPSPGVPKVTTTRPATRTQPVRSRKYKPPIVDDGVDSEDDDPDGNYEPEEKTKPCGFDPIDEIEDVEDFEYDDEVDDVNLEDLLDPSQEFVIEPQDERDIAEVNEQIRRFDRQSLPPAIPSKPSLQSDSDEDNFSEFDDEEGLFHGNTMSAEQYRKDIQELDENDYKRTEYRESTTERIDYAERQWRLYCRRVLQTKDWKQCMSRITFRVLIHFLRWHLNQRVGKGGRKKRQVKSQESVTNFWCNFRLAFERAMFFKINTLVDYRLISNGLAQLKKPLAEKRRMNRAMTIEDLKTLILRTLSTTEKSFRYGEQRILLVLFLLLLAPQGSRPKSILDLRFGDLTVVFIRDPEDPSAPPILTIRMNMEWTKRYLGGKPVKTFTVPEIIFEPDLCLSPHIFLLAILFRHQAFASPTLNNNPHQLDTMQIHPMDEELELGLKPEFADRFVFRRAVKTALGLQTSEKQISSGMINEWVKTVGKLAGFKYNTICYTLRYMAGNVMDKNVSTDMRNVVMEHAHGSNTFMKHYLCRHINVDLWPIHRGMPQRTALLNKATSHGNNVSLRRPVKLTTSQAEALLEDPEYLRLTKMFEALPRGSPERQKVFLRRKSYLHSIRTAELKRTREDWDKAQGLIDVERQLQGHAITQDTDVRRIRPMSAAQQQMVNAITVPLVHEYEAQMMQRMDAVLSLVAYSYEEEPLVTPVTEAATPQRPAELSLPISPQQQMMEIKRSVLTDHNGGMPVLRCFICVAHGEAVGAGHHLFNMYCHTFSRNDSAARHFITHHLDVYPENASFECPLCRVTLIHKQHLQNHAHQKHGLRTDIRFKRPPRREYL